MSINKKSEIITILIKRNINNTDTSPKVKKLFDFHEKVHTE